MRLFGLIAAKGKVSTITCKDTPYVSYALAEGLVAAMREWLCRSWILSSEKRSANRAVRRDLQAYKAGEVNTAIVRTFLEIQVNR